MSCEENYMTFVENEECCGAITYKLRKKRPLIIIIVLLILAIVTLVAGMYKGLTFKKYSDVALAVGILFPGIILVFVCLYLAFICGRDNFRSSVRSQVHNLSNENDYHQNKNGVQYLRTNSASGDYLSVRYQSRVNATFVNNPLATRNHESPFKKMHYTENDSSDYSEAKISRRRFRSFSNSDISKEILQNHDEHYENPEICKVNYRKTDDNQCYQKFSRHHDIPRHRAFKRCVSDTTNKNRNRKSREDRFVWNTQSLHNLKNRVDRLNSIQDATRENCYVLPSDAKRKQTENLFLQNNFRATLEYGNETSFNEDEDCNQMYRKRQGEYINLPKNIQKKSCYAKSEIHLYSSNDPSCKYKQTLRFSSIQPCRKAVKDSDGAGESSPSENENNDSVTLSDILKMERKKMQNKQAGNSVYGQDTYRSKRKTIYLPSTSNKQWTRPPKEYAHEHCRYSQTDNKIKH